VQFPFEAFSANGADIYKALVFCLSADEALQLYETIVDLGQQREEVHFRKIRKDIRCGITPDHHRLIAQLENDVHTLHGRSQTSAASALLAVIEALPDDQEHSILQRLSQCRNGNVRRQVYRRLKEFPEDICPEYLITSWATFRDFEAARLLLLRAPPEFLFRYLREFEAHFEGARLGRLYRRVASHDVSVVERLAQIDPITYAYVCTQVGIAVPAEQMLSIYRASMSTDKAGLVIWCAGQMGLWDTLSEMGRLAQNPPEERN
jgi:hypothetical protein